MQHRKNKLKGKPLSIREKFRTLNLFFYMIQFSIDGKL